MGGGTVGVDGGDGGRLLWTSGRRAVVQSGLQMWSDVGMGGRMLGCWDGQHGSSTSRVSMTDDLLT